MLTTPADIIAQLSRISLIFHTVQYFIYIIDVVSLYNILFNLQIWDSESLALGGTQLWYMGYLFYQASGFMLTKSLGIGPVNSLSR